jgi:zinc D-Ala-D-Ala carboxypeptidase
MSFRYFTREEFDCQETGENEMKDEFIHALDALRHECGFSFQITSGYRSPNHSIEAKKSKPGTHAQGIAADIAVADGNQRYLIVKNAMAMAFSGIGIHKNFIHVDTRQSVPVLWEY